SERIDQGATLLDSMFVDGTAAQQPTFWTPYGRFTRDLNAASLPGEAAPRALFMQLFSGAVPQGIDSIVDVLAEAIGQRSDAEARASIRRNLTDLASLIGFHARRTGRGLDTASV